MGPTHRASTLLPLFAMVLVAVGCTGEPQPDGFVVVVESAPQAVDPRLVYDDIGTKISKLVFAGLVSFDTPDASADLVLAESIEQPSPTRYDVTLQQNLRFHDGTPLTADDVRFTFESTPRLMTPIERIDVHDDRRLSFVLHEPYAPFLMALATGVVSRRELEGRNAELAEALARASLSMGRETATIGAGPYRLVSPLRETHTVLERFDDYVLGTPEIDRLVFSVVRDDNARIIALLGGSADLAVNNVTPLMIPVVEDDAALTVATSESVKYTYLMFNTRVTPLDDVRVRQAVAFAIDREEIVRYKFRGLATLATGMLAPGHWAYHGDVPRYARDPERARELLDEAGLEDPDGDGPKMRFEVTYRTSASKFRKAIAELIAAQLGEVGIGVKVETMEFGTFFGLVHGGQFEMASLQWPSPVEPDLMYIAFHSDLVPWEHPEGRGRNRGGFANAELDRVLEAGRGEPDRERRRPFYARAQEILADELPYVPLWHEHNIAVHKEGLEAFTVTPNARLRQLEHATFSGE